MTETHYTLDVDAITTNAPACLRERPQWVAWRYIERKGKTTKLPINPSRGGEASSTKPATWGTFEQSLAACGRSTDLRGVGFVFSPDDPFAGVDLDDCIDLESGQLKPWAQEFVDLLGSYTEVSPSGSGVKVFLRARKGRPRCRKAYADGEVEMYDRERFFTVTGEKLESAPAEVNERQDEFDRSYDKVFGAERANSPGPSEVPSQPPSDGNGQVMLTDEEILRLAKNSRRNGAKFTDLWEGRWSQHFPSPSEADLSIASRLAFYSKDAVQIDRVFRRSALFRDKWDEQHGDQTYGAMTIAKALASVTEQYQPKNSKRRAHSSNGTADARPSILINTEEYRVVGETVAALSADPDLYQRGGMLVRVIRDRAPKDGIRRCDGSATIQAVPVANLRERMTRWARFTKPDGEGGEFSAHPPAWLVSAVDARGEWPEVRQLMAVTDVPILRPDGSIWQEPGYDPVTEVLFERGNVVFPPVHPESNLDDATEALIQLDEIVCDFPFESQEHRAAWFASFFTPLARFAFEGPSPLFLIDANIRGAGKGLLAQTIGHIALGREMPVSSYAHDAEEMRKKITAIAIAGDRLILLDNLEGAFGNDAIDRALTCTRWKDRILGRSEQVDLPLTPVWFATGNNVQVGSDTLRRVIHIRLDCLNEQPEERSGFRHANLLDWVDRRRGPLLSNAMTILSAFLRCGTRCPDLKPFGSFEGWSSVVREAVIWVGLPDPCLTRIKLAESSDTTGDILGQIIEAWRQYDSSDQGLVVAEVLAALYPPQRDQTPSDPASVAMRAALENLVGCPPGKVPGARQVGRRLSHFRRRVVGGVFLDSNANEYARGGAVWRLHDVEHGV